MSKPLSDDQKWAALILQLKAYAAEHDLSCDEMRLRFDVGIMAVSMAHGLPGIYRLLPDEAVAPTTA